MLLKSSNSLYLPSIGRQFLRSCSSLERWRLFLAEAHTDHASLVAVDHALLHPAKIGDNAILKLRIQNRSTQIIHLLRIETPVATGSRIVFDDGKGRVGFLDSLAIRPGDDLDLGSSHMWVELVRRRILKHFCGA